ncbi:hypothetical protein FNV43_RR02090 [Rhamnella rubrinervis]|uniref:Uncharacterized protein n=1 Tax=Rhamnella rubrinervis TaxID=2594499 RepID=A0A8K0MSX8_9ROSA|nr:hypothetical protein FNV43_RR02090 [Rhamnella rubrinervis]
MWKFLRKALNRSLSTSLKRLLETRGLTIGYKILYRVFLGQMCLMITKLLIVAKLAFIMTIRMLRKETLRIVGCSDDMMLSVMMADLKPSKLLWSLRKNDP